MNHPIAALLAQPPSNGHVRAPDRNDFHRDTASVPDSLRAESFKRPSTTTRAHRKLAMLQRTGLFAESTPGITVDRARTAEELRAAYRLVHDVYVERGYCTEMDWGMRLRVFEAAPQMATFVAKNNQGVIVGVLSVVGDCEQFGLPSDSAFGEEITNIRAKGYNLCEVTNQAIDPRYRKSSLPTQLMRCAMAHGIMMGYQRAIATVSPGHTGFYNLLNFFAIAPTRSYSRTINDPVIALCGDLDVYRAEPTGLDEASAFVHRFMTAENPFVTRVAHWANEARLTFFDADLLRRLFTCWSSFLDECSESEVVFIEEQWGWNLFDEVTEPPPLDDVSAWTGKKASWLQDFSRKHLCECWSGFPSQLTAC